MRHRLNSVLDRILNLGFATWLLPVLAAGYLFFFIWPVFLTPGSIKFFRYLPAMDSIGADLSETLRFSSHWASTGASPYILTNAYPPLTAPFFAPLLNLEFSQAYRFVTLMSLVAYAAITLALPLGMRTIERIPAVFSVIVVTGLFSYGLQFELERGQFNVIAVLLSLAAVWMYHHHVRFRLLAYVFLTLSVQLKLYPLIFALMLIRDWRSWRDNLKRMVLLGLTNLALFFALGTGVFLESRAESRAGGSPPMWIYNHSVRAFVGLGMERLHQRGYALPDEAGSLLEAAIYLGLALCLAVIVARIVRGGQTGLNVHLLLACTVVALVVPPVSNDYTLAVLAAPIALLLLRPAESTMIGRAWGRRLVATMASIGLAAAYVATLFAHTYKPPTLWLENNFPALFAMLLAVVVLSIVSPTVASSAIPAPPARAGAT